MPPQRHDWKRYIWHTYRGREALAQRWYQMKHEVCKSCGRRHISFSDYIIGIRLTPQEIEDYRKGVKGACKIGRQRDYFIS